MYNLQNQNYTINKTWIFIIYNSYLLQIIINAFPQITWSSVARFNLQILQDVFFFTKGTDNSLLQPYIKVKDLISGKRYKVQELQRMSSQFDECIIMILKDKRRMYLPKTASHKLITNPTNIEELKTLSKSNLLEVFTDGNKLIFCIRVAKSENLCICYTKKKYIFFCF